MSTDFLIIFDVFTKLIKLFTSELKVLEEDIIEERVGYCNLLLELILLITFIRVVIVVSTVSVCLVSFESELLIFSINSKLN